MQTASINNLIFFLVVLVVVWSTSDAKDVNNTIINQPASDEINLYVPILALGWRCNIYCCIQQLKFSGYFLKMVNKYILNKKIGVKANALSLNVGVIF